MQVIEAYKKVREEIGVVSILQNLRVLNRIAKQQVSKREWKSNHRKNSLQFFD